MCPHPTVAPTVIQGVSVCPVCGVGPAQAKAIAEAWAARFTHGVEGPHFVSCGHPVTHVPMHRQNRL
jgi:hypothetical protein